MKPDRSVLRITLLCLAATLVLVPASAQTTRTVSRTFDLNRNGTVEVNAFTGSIEVTGWDRNRVQVDARIEADDEELVDETGLEFDASSGRLDIEVDYDDVEDAQKILGLFSIGNVDRPEVNFVITMPRTANLTVEDFSSEIDVRGLRGDVTLETFSSSIRLENIEGAVDIETFSGSIEGENLSGQIQAETFSGDARLRLNALPANNHFETFSGDIELTLPAGTGFELVADESTFGDLQSEFALKADGERRIAGEGGPRIEIETFSGTLRLRKQ